MPWIAPYYARLGFEPTPDGDHGSGLATLCDLIAAKGIDVAPRLFMRRPVVG